jgi:hypothetical protein
MWYDIGMFRNRKALNKAMYIMAIVIAVTTVLMLFSAAFIK